MTKYNVQRDEMEAEIFHGTDYKNAVKIKSEGFTYKPNKEHWLGNGVYFYQDYSLARWWTQNPTSKFGTKVEKPAILCCKIEVDDNKVLNLLKLEDYFMFRSIFEKEFYPRYRQRRIKYIPHTLIVGMELPLEPISKEKMRCAYCDYLKREFELDMIVGNFYKVDQPYLPQEPMNIFDSFLLQYTEIQICIFNTDIIKEIQIKEL